MINLLSPETKKSLRSGRNNVILSRYVWSICAALLAIAAIFGGGYYITVTEKAKAIEERTANETMVEKYASTQREAEAFASNLKGAKSILENEVVFSELITEIAATLPTGTVLSNLNLSTSITGEEIVLNALTLDSGDAPLRLKAALEASPLFERANIQGITAPPESAASKYKATVSIRVTVTKLTSGEQP